jgi:hypothetical protein
VKIRRTYDPIIWDAKHQTLRRATWFERVRCRLARRFLWWREGRWETTAIDTKAGTCTVEALRWSWRRWRWERVA